jgi:hypothetical protein
LDGGSSSFYVEVEKGQSIQPHGESEETTNITLELWTFFPCFKKNGIASFQ